MRWYVPVWLLSLYPLAVVISANVGVVPLRAVVVGRAVAVALGAITLLVLALRVVQRDLAARAAWVSLLLLLLTFYSTVLLALERAARPFDAGDPRFAISYVVVSGIAATVAIRPWQVRPRSPAAFTIVAVALLVMTLVPGLFAAARGDGSRPPEESSELLEMPAAPDSVARWRPPADALIASALSGMQAVPAPPRDIYYIVLDGFGRADAVREYYGVDLSGFTNRLRSSGMYVPDGAQTNYAQTFLSLASTLNLNYLDPVAAAVGTDSRDRRPLAYLIQQNALMRMASRAGYEVVVVGSDHMSTERIAAADVCLCSQYGLDEFELATVALTPLAPLAGRWRYDAYEAHRRKVRASFAAIAAAASRPGPQLVFAHMLVPHPPFVFEADGSPRAQPRPAAFRFQDGNHFKGSTPEYVAGYAEQVQFVAGQLTALVESLLDGTTPAPVIVIHGDHGPGSRLRWEQPDATDMRERLGIFAAYYLPGSGPVLYPAMTPVNGARLVARYFGVELPLVPDESFFSRWSRPYDFIRVPAAR